MSQGTFRMRRRVGGALLAGVTALGVAALAGQGVANAAAVSGVTASLTTVIGSVPGTSGTPTASNAASLQLGLNGTPSLGDQVVITIACPTTGSVSWYGLAPTAAPTTPSTLAATTSASPVVLTDTAGNTWHAFYGTDGNGCGNNELILVDAGTAATQATATPAIALTGIELETTGVTAQTLSLSGSYLTLGAAAINITVPSIASINWFNVTSNVPPVQLSGTAAQSVSNLTIGQPATLGTSAWDTSAANAYSSWMLTVTLSNGTFASAPTVSVVPTTGSAAPATQTAPLTTTVAATPNDTATATFTAVNPAVATNFVFSGISVVPSGNGAVTADISLTNAGSKLATPAANSTVVVANGVQLASFLGGSARIYGQTPDATVAQEFLAAFPVTAAVHPTTAVLATDLDPYDALSAAYLEAQLGTGLLITPPTSLGADAAMALRLEGISTVYVVGGPDAITPAVITELQNTPVYNVGGVTTTGANIKVIGPIYGQTAADTAQSIATYFGGAYGSVSVPAAYNATGGAFNDTTGTASTSGPVGSTQTAFVISETDWQDATTLGPIAYADRLPVILTPPTSLGTQASAALTSLNVKQVIVVGGQLALANTVVSQIQALNGGISVLRIAGQDYTDTATQLAKFETATAGTGLGWEVKGFLISHGDYWSDALGAAALSASNFNNLGNEPILTTLNPTTIGQYLQSYLSSVASATTPYAVNVLGGPLAVTPTVVTSIQSTLAS